MDNTTKKNLIIKLLKSLETRSPKPFEVKSYSERGEMTGAPTKSSAKSILRDFDLLIGSTAVANDLIMITEKSKKFERISGIEIENWIKR